MSKKGNAQTSAFLCPFKFSKKKSKKTYDSHLNNSKHSHSLSHPHPHIRVPCSSSCETVFRAPQIHNLTKMYVSEDYDQVEEDEITVKQGDKVLLETIDRAADRDWAYVYTIDGKSGFVPNSILLRLNNGIKKKIITKFNGPELALSNTSSDKECNRLPKEMTTPPSNSFSLRHPSHHQSFHNLHSNRLLTNTNHNFSQTMRPGEISSNQILRHHHHYHQHHQSKDHDYLNFIVNHNSQTVMPRGNHPCQNQLLSSAPATVLMSPTSRRSHHQNFIHMIPSQQHSPNLNDLADSCSNDCGHRYDNFNSPLLEFQHPDEAITPTEKHEKMYIGEYVVLFNFTAMAENDINVEPLEIVYVLNKDDPDWYWISRKMDRNEGFVPSQFICERTKYDQFNKLISEPKQPSCDHFIDNQCSNGNIDLVPDKQQIIYQNQSYH